MNTLAILILAAYQFLGVHSGPGQHSLEQRLTQTASQHHLEFATGGSTPVQPMASTAISAFHLDATSVYAVDVATMAPLYAQNPNQRLPIASLTKMASALVTLKTTAPGQIITVPTLPAYASNDALLHLAAGEQFRYDQLLAAALIPSDNDAADSLALADSGTIPAFSAKMNRLVASWGITGVHYSNPSGLIDDNNYATAKSLAELAKLGLQNPLFAQLTSTLQTTVTNLAGKTYALTSTNMLYSDPRVHGIKTGFTAAAGQCFVSLATIKGHQVITVVLGSTDRFGQTEQLLNWIESNYTWQ